MAKRPDPNPISSATACPSDSESGCTSAHSSEESRWGSCNYPGSALHEPGTCDEYGRSNIAGRYAHGMVVGARRVE